MAYELRNNTGSIFKNGYKEKPGQPDMKGNAMIDGKEYWVSVWVKKDKNSQDWFSFAVTEKDQNKPVMDNTSAGRDDAPKTIDDDNIPW